jgi:hypothetical protein
MARSLSARVDRDIVRALPLRTFADRRLIRFEKLFALQSRLRFADRTVVSIVDVEQVQLVVVLHDFALRRDQLDGRWREV